MSEAERSAEPAIPGNAGRNDYPRMVYHADGRTMVVATAAEEHSFRLKGFGQRPHTAHTQRQASNTPILSGLDPMAVTLRATLEAVLDERGLTKALANDLRLLATQLERKP